MGMTNWVKFISFKLLNRKYVLDEVFLKENYGISGDISTTSAAAAASLPTSKKPRSNSGVRAVLTIRQEKKLSFYVISNKSELGKKWLLKMCREKIFSFILTSCLFHKLWRWSQDEYEQCSRNNWDTRCEK